MIEHPTGNHKALGSISSETKAFSFIQRIFTEFGRLWTIFRKNFHPTLIRGKLEGGGAIVTH